MCGAGRSSDSGRPPPPPSRPAGQWRVAGEHLPSQRRDRPGLAPGSLTALRVRADPIIGLCPPTSSVSGSPWSAGRRSSSPSRRCRISAPGSAAGISRCGSWRMRRSTRCSERSSRGHSRPRSTAVVAGVLYAVTDELHQTLVPGRQGSLAMWRSTRPAWSPAWRWHAGSARSAGGTRERAARRPRRGPGRHQAPVARLGRRVGAGAGRRCRHAPRPTGERRPPRSTPQARETGARCSTATRRSGRRSTCARQQTRAQRSAVSPPPARRRRVHGRAGGAGTRRTGSARRGPACGGARSRSGRAPRLRVPPGCRTPPSHGRGRI